MTFKIQCTRRYLYVVNVMLHVRTAIRRSEENVTYIIIILQKWKIPSQLTNLANDIINVYYFKPLRRNHE